MSTTQSKKRRRRLACPDCGGREFDWISSGTERSVVVFYDDGETKTISTDKRGFIAAWVDVECAECGRAVDSDELV
jgi:DNA-directed RNA polymerase subunit RPC12/RpoP